MLAAIVLFDQFTALDAVGPYEVLSRLPGAEVVFAAHVPGPVVNEKGTLRLAADAALADVLRPDVIVVPGGPGQNARMADEALLGWLRTADSRSAWTASVCTGALEYDPQPPYQAGSPATAPPTIADALRDQILT